MSEISYCLKCKTVVDIKDAEVKLTKNNRKMLSGICVQCGTKTNKFLKKGDDNKVDEVVKEVEVVKEDKKVKVDEVKDIIEKFQKKIKALKRHKKKKELIE